MTPPRSTTLTIWLLIAAAAGMALPVDRQAAVRQAAGDLVRPGCLVWRDVQARLAALEWPGTSPPPDGKQELARLQQELQAAQRVVRQQEVQLARLHEAAATLKPPLFASAAEFSTERLAGPVLIEAGVLGSPHAEAWRKGRWLDQGKSSGLIDEAPLLASSLPLVDVGRDARVSGEDAVLLGRTVIGKIAQVGRWTSTFLLVTDAGFRGRAQLVRETTDGFLFGAKGVLKGQGESLCRLEGVPATELVDVGDSVYTADRDGVLPTPLYYGQVVEAKLPDRAREWTILVQPAERPADLTKVEIIRTALNPRRGLAN